jgi:hypothetical protein
MEKTLEKHRIQTQLNKKLRLLVEKEGVKAIGEITDLLHKGADPNDRAKFDDSLICTVLYKWPADSQAAGIELLTSFGANVNLPDGQNETALSACLNLKYPVEIQNLLLSKGAIPIPSSTVDFKPSEVNCRYGNANPEKVSNGYYSFMVATGKAACEIGRSNFMDLIASGKIKDYEKDFEELTSKVEAGKLSGAAAAGFFNYLTNGKPKWCNDRYGSSYHFLKDGTLIQIGGEHEDFYDPEFNIYNDVIKISPNGAVALFLYPEHIFPPTDFHSSTKLGNQIIIIGGLGYQKDRKAKRTNMYVLNLKNFSIKSLPSSGDKPGWVFEHTTLLDEKKKCLYLMDGKKWENGKIVDNKAIYKFDLKTSHWSQKQ